MKGKIYYLSYIQEIISKLKDKKHPYVFLINKSKDGFYWTVSKPWYHNPVISCSRIFFNTEEHAFLDFQDVLAKAHNSEESYFEIEIFNETEYDGSGVRIYFYDTQDEKNFFTIETSFSTIYEAMSSLIEEGEMKELIKKELFKQNIISE